MQKVDRPVGKSRGEYVKTIYKEEHCMRKGMYGKLTMLAVAGVMALSGCGNSGGVFLQKSNTTRIFAACLTKQHSSSA